jgi:hypothetical protein
MPIHVTVQFDLARFARALDAIHLKQLPYAASRALNDVAAAAKRQVTDDLPRIFDRPTPFTQNALGTSSATKSNLQSAVFVKRIQGQYLLPEEIGGERLPSMNTRKPGVALVIPSKIERDSYGNIPDGAVRALRQAVQDEAKGVTRREKAARASASAKAKISYGAGQGIALLRGAGPKGRGGPGGFFVRQGTHLMRLTSFAPEAHYKPIFSFRKRIEAVARAGFTTALLKRLREAVSETR